MLYSCLKLMILGAMKINTANERIRRFNFLSCIAYWSQIKVIRDTWEKEVDTKPVFAIGLQCKLDVKIDLYDMFHYSFSSTNSTHEILVGLREGACLQCHAVGWNMKLCTWEVTFLTTHQCLSNKASYLLLCQFYCILLILILSILAKKKKIFWTHKLWL